MSELLRIANCDTNLRKGDVIFLHGLNGHAEETWRSSDDFFWPQQVGIDLPEIGIWSVQYDAASSKWFGHAMSIVDRATNILHLLVNHRIGEFPFVLVTHSLGGLLVKQLVHAALSYGQTDWSQCVSNLRGIVFLATPHTGSSLATFIDKFRLGARTTELVNELRDNAPMLQDLAMTFRQHSSQLGIRIQVYRETKTTTMVLVVDAASSDPGMPGVVVIPVDADHISICKPADQNAEVYVGIKNFIKTAIDAPQSGQFRNVDTPPILQEIPPTGQLDDGPRNDPLCKEITKASTSTTIAQIGQTTEDLEHRVEELSGRPPLNDDEYVEIASVQCLFAEIEGAKKELANQHVEQLTKELKDLFEGSDQAWPTSLRKKVVRLLAEDLTRKIARARPDERNADLALLKKYIRELRNG